MSKRSILSSLGDKRPMASVEKVSLCEKVF